MIKKLVFQYSKGEILKTHCHSIFCGNNILGIYCHWHLGGYKKHIEVSSNMLNMMNNAIRTLDNKDSLYKVTKKYLNKKIFPYFRIRTIELTLFNKEHGFDCFKY